MEQDQTQTHRTPFELAKHRVRASGNEHRPAWAKPQPAWPFRVIDPVSHTLGAPAQVAPGWSS